MRFVVEGKHFEMKLFKSDGITIIMTIMLFRCPSFIQHKLTSGSRFLKFHQRSVDGKDWMRFQSKTSVFKFFPRSVDGVFCVQITLLDRKIIFLS